MDDRNAKRIDESFYDKNVYSNESKNKLFVELDSPFQRYRITKVLGIYTPNKNERVLDLGCGWGTFCFAVSPLCNHVTGVDFSRKSIELCNRLLAEKKYANVDFVLADAQDTGLPSESYDVIICADLFEHLYPKQFEKVLDECTRLLKKGGKLVVWTPHRGHIFEILKNNNILLKKDEAHVDYKSTEPIINALTKRNFSIKKSYYTESQFPVFSTIEKTLLPVLPLMRRRIAILAEKTA